MAAATSPTSSPGKKSSPSSTSPSAVRFSARGPHLPSSLRQSITLSTIAFITSSTDVTNPCTFAPPFSAFSLPSLDFPTTKSPWHNAVHTASTIFSITAPTTPDTELWFSVKALLLDICTRPSLLCPAIIFAASSTIFHTTSFTISSVPPCPPPLLSPGGVSCCFLGAVREALERAGALESAVVFASRCW
eukprot:CAMPEP_0169479582 /NCGR_PEP_ID=MMETSP1042-20121227/29100_1 /TAXON_ID=464988 /ORGANISM="Hemiselmis andersenii, Strain CCMP1180" /LENGTH=189 /DNA_ID=CAMNT_0009594155 /DNA_START=161 /DNA_END=727 /DNA_ORIENTATION=-